jgi:hypothetical protein
MTIKGIRAAFAGMPPAIRQLDARLESGAI